MTTYLILTGIGSLMLFGATAYKAIADSREKKKNETAQSEASREQIKAEEKRHQEMIEVIAAAKLKEEAYKTALTELGKAKEQNSPLFKDNRIPELNAVDERFDHALRGVAPAVAERLKREAQLIVLNAQGDQMARQYTEAIHSEISALVPVFNDVIIRAKESGLFTSANFEPIQPIPTEIIARDSDNHTAPIITADLGTAEAKLRIILAVHCGNVVVRKSTTVEDGPECSLPQLLLDVTSRGQTVIKGAIDFDKKSNQLTAIIGSDSVTQGEIEEINTRLRGHSGHDLAARWLAEIIAFARIKTARTIATP